MERVLDASRQETAQLLASLQRRANRTWTPMDPPPTTLSLEGAQPLVPGLHGNQSQQEVLQPLSAGPPAPCGSGLRCDCLSPQVCTSVGTSVGTSVRTDCLSPQVCTSVGTSVGTSVRTDCLSPQVGTSVGTSVRTDCLSPPGVHYRKSCASSGACLISSSGYQQFCTGRLHSVCISCCSQPLCNGPRRRRSQPSASSGPAPRLWSPAPFCWLLPLLLLLMLGEGLV
ncbi:unnamed protein product [Boreogadus saida]